MQIVGHLQDAPRFFFEKILLFTSFSPHVSPYLCIVKLNFKFTADLMQQGKELSIFSKTFKKYYKIIPTQLVDSL